MFLTVLHRLFAGGSDRSADRCWEDRRIDGVEDLKLHHLYRAMAWLGDGLAEDQQDGATPFARRRDLFSTLDLVFVDTTSLYSEGAGGQTLGRRGFSKDHRPDLNQMILAVLLDGDGRPVCAEMWPGDTADTGGLIPVADRDMISDGGTTTGAFTMPTVRIRFSAWDRLTTARSPRLQRKSDPRSGRGDERLWF